MNGVGLIGILPIIVLAAASVVLMLMIAVKRDYQLAWRGALAGVVAALLSIPIAASVAPTTATDLMIVDGFALFFSALLLVTGAYVLIFSYRYFQVREGENEERSEERRVGKECRSRWSPYQEKKKKKKNSKYM